MCTWLFYSNYQTLVPLSHSVQPSFCICALFLLYSLSPVHRQIDQKCSWLCKSKLCVMIVAINNFWTKELSLVGDLSDRSWVSLVTALKYGMKWWSGKWNCGGLVNCILWSNLMHQFSWFTWCTGSPFHLMHWFPWCTGCFTWCTWCTAHSIIEIQCAQANHAPLKLLYYAHSLLHIGPHMKVLSRHCWHWSPPILSLVPRPPPDFIAAVEKNWGPSISTDKIWEGPGDEATPY